jgi:hypothetical protein
MSSQKNRNSLTWVRLHHKKVQLTDIHFGPNLDVRHFGYTLTSKLTSWTSIFKSDIQKSKKLDVRHPVWFLELNVHTHLKWNWMSISRHFINGCQTFWMSHFKNGCKTFQKWMSHLSDISRMDVRHFGCHISKMDVRHFKNGCQTKMNVRHSKMDVRQK